jgi:hypothetical protein
MLRREMERDLARPWPAMSSRSIISPDGAGKRAEVGLKSPALEPPDKGMISPASFIPIADRGLIVPIENWVLEQSCKLAATWRNPPSRSQLARPVCRIAGRCRLCALANMAQPPPA